MQRNREKGQAALIALLALGILLIGAVGMASDTSQLWVQRQMAQTAADAAAQAAILSMFNGTNVGSNKFADTTAYNYTCQASDIYTPCSYARKNGFGGTAADTVVVDVPGAGAVGLDSASLSSSDPVALIRVTVTRRVTTWFVPMLGGAASANVKTSAVAAIVSVKAPPPIVVLHPHLDNALSMNGTTKIRICGGPTLSIQVNSDSPNAYTGGGVVDLSLAGPGSSTSGGCTTPHGNGGDFGVFGGRTSDPGSISYGTRPGVYISPSSKFKDPLIGVPPPPRAGTVNPTPVATTNLHGCDPVIDTKGCHLYSPGIYTGGIAIGPNDTALFAPGIYYMDSNGFTTKANGVMRMCSDCTASANPDISDGMLVYNNYTSGTAPVFQVGGGGDVRLKGTPQVKAGGVPALYAGMLFFQARNAPSATHILGGGGCLQLQGTLYMTNTEATTLSTGKYQTIEYHGNPCSSTFIIGEIITDVLQLKGTADLAMLLQSEAYLGARRVALIQ